MPTGVYERTDEYRQTMSVALLGNTNGVGHVHSEEHKAKIGEASSEALWHRYHGQPSTGWYISPHGYKILTGQIHSLANRYELAEHRKVLYEEIGPGPHPCYWCGRLLNWGGLSGIVADHLDGDKLNNDIENLVPSCNPCNVARHKTQATHCTNGHEYTVENTRIISTGTRQCRECGRINKRKRRGRVAP